MISFGQAPLKDIWAMLDQCAPGHTRTTRVHNYCIYYRDRSFPRLPLGEHGKRTNPAIELGHVRQMVRQLDLDPDCVKRFLPQLKFR